MASRGPALARCPRPPQTEKCQAGAPQASCGPYRASGGARPLPFGSRVALGPLPSRPSEVRRRRAKPGEAAAAEPERSLAGAGAPWEAAGAEAPKPREWAPLSPPPPGLSRLPGPGAGSCPTLPVPGRAEHLGIGSLWFPGSSVSFHGAEMRLICAPTEGTCAEELSEAASRAWECQ